MNRPAGYVTAIVVAHMLLSIAHGLAHLELHVGLVRPDVIFVILVVLLLPLVAMGLVWTAEKRLGLILLSFDVRIAFIRDVSPFYGYEPRSCAFPTAEPLGTRVCSDRLWIVHYRSDWNLPGSSLSLDRQSAFKQSRLSVHASRT